MSFLQVKKLMKLQTISGFTLIELLVVIAIISLLSSIVLSSLSSAKIKAENAKINAIIIQYRNALELYRSSNNYYPNQSIFDICLGDYNNSIFVGNRCGYKQNGVFASGNPNSTFKNSLLSYIPSFPAVSNIITPSDSGSPSYRWLGAIYRYNSFTKISRIVWNLRGLNQSCGQGVMSGTNTESTGSYTSCYFTLGPP